VQQVGAIKMTPVEVGKGGVADGQGARPGDTSPWDVQVVVSVAFAVGGANGYYFTRFQLQLHFALGVLMPCAIKYKMKFYALSAAFNTKPAEMFFEGAPPPRGEIIKVKQKLNQGCPTNCHTHLPPIFTLHRRNATCLALKLITLLPIFC